MGGLLGISGGTSSSSSTPIDLTAGPFKDLQQPFADQLKNFFQTGGPGFQGPFTAPIGQGEAAGIGQLADFAFGSPTARASDEQLASTIRGDFLDPSNPALQGAIDAAVRPIMENFGTQEAMDRVLFSRAGQKIQESSPFSTARARATEATSRAVGDTSANLVNANFQAERDRQLRAIGDANNRVQAQTQAIQALALPRLVQDLGIQRGIEEFNRRMAAIQQALQISSGVTDETIGNVQESSSAKFGISA